MFEAFKVSPFGALHTLISLIAVGAGIVSLVRFKEIAPKRAAGWIYVVATVFTCVTGLAIFRHGGFGKPHALAIITLVVLCVAALGGGTNLFGSLSRYVETVGYSLTFFFHLVPAVNETATRLPLGAPLAASPEDPALQIVAGLLFLGFVVGANLQIRRLRRDTIQTILVPRPGLALNRELRSAATIGRVSSS